VKYARGEKIPFGWILDATGKPSNNPADLYSGGALLTFGESKGYALNLLMEAAGGALSGGGVLDTFAGTNGILAQAINIDFFSDVGEFEDNIDKMIRVIRASPPVEGVKEILLPGGPEDHEMRKRMATGIPVEERTWEKVVEVARRYCVDIPASRPSPSEPVRQ
jgi:uncharacterized oxidoreductase